MLIQGEIHLPHYRNNQRIRTFKFDKFNDEMDHLEYNISLARKIYGKDLPSEIGIVEKSMKSGSVMFVKYLKDKKNLKKNKIICENTFTFQSKNEHRKKN